MDMKQAKNFNHIRNILPMESARIWVILEFSYGTVSFFVVSDVKTSPNLISKGKGKITFKNAEASKSCILEIKSAFQYLRRK